MNEKHREVKLWLEKTFGDSDDIPQYEINHRTVDVLHALMTRSERQDAYGVLLTEDLKQKEAEYAAEGERLRRLLEKLGLVPGALSQSGTVSLRTLANVALLLDARDASDSCLLLGLTGSSQASMRVKELRRIEQRTTAQLFNKTKAALLRCRSLRKALDSLEEQTSYQGPELEKKAREAGFVQSKAKEYHSRVQELEVEFAKSGADRNVFHSALTKKSEDLKHLRDRLQPLKEKLESYHKLPPDVALCKVKVEEAKAELAAVEEELAQNFNLVSI